MSIRIPIISEFDGKGIERARKEFANLETVGEKAGFLIKKAFLPATAAIGGLAVVLGDATMAAAEDAAAQAQLALTLQNVTAATDAQIAAVEQSISAMSMASGIADDQLRPAFEALTRGTKDIGISTRDMSLVMDIATATQRPLVDVANALAMAYQGNTRGLRTLTPEMAALIKEGASMDEIMQVLGGTFGGATKIFAETAQGGFARLSNSINETKEAVGAALLPIVEKALPVLNKFAAWASNNPKAFLAIAGAIGAVATAIIAVNVAMMLNPFSAIAAGIALLVSGLVIAYNKFEWFRTGVNTLLNFMLGAFEGFANSLIGAVNIIISALNFIPGVDIPTIGTIKLPRIGGGGGGTSLASIYAEREGTLPSGAAFAVPAGAIPPLAVGGGSGGGGGGGGVSVAPRGLTGLTTMTPAEIAQGNANADFFAGGLDNPRVRQEITVNVNGGLATSAEIGEAVVNSIRSFNTVHGPANIAVAV
jgi:hypothetical protein